jgi:hypothetical protein
MGVLYLGIVIFMAVALALGWNSEVFSQTELPEWFFTGYLGFLFFICSTFAVIFFLSFFLKPQAWTWFYHIILISVGLTSPCTLPASVPLLIYWLKPETQRYFGRA